MERQIVGKNNERGETGGKVAYNVSAGHDRALMC